MLDLKDEELTKNVHGDVDRLAEEVVSIYIYICNFTPTFPLLHQALIRVEWDSACEQNFFLQHCHNRVKN